MGQEVDDHEEGSGLDGGETCLGDGDTDDGTAKPGPFGLAILARLEECSMSRSDLLEAMAAHGHKVSRKSLSSWILGHRRPRYPEFVAMLDVLGVPASKRGNLLRMVAEAA